MTKPSDSGTGRAEPRRKRHHYLPESYLKAWADGNGQVAVRRRDQNVPFFTATHNVAVEADLYALPTDAGLDDALEVALSKIEAPLRGHLADLREGAKARRGTAVRTEISRLLALQLVRTPEHLDRFLFPLAAAEFTGERPISRDGMRRFLTDEYLGEPPAEPELQGALDFANYVLSQGEPTKREIFSILFRIADEELTPRLGAMAWAVEISPRHAFVTTDRPVAVWRRDPHSLKRMGAGLESADEVRFPLGPHHLLVLRPRFPEHRTVVEPDRVAGVNRHLAAACYEMVIGRPAERADLERFKLRRVRPAMRFNTGPLFETDPSGGSVPTGREILHMYVPYDDEVDTG
ncbi:DUF4238 domain-containing protein [Micromonospora sp. NPDC049836]|uniref:DUF4238 domain-containing protein n=1 Tax=Micromonospora sp. NPDC049836 TaxID=3364274 RepID=UPI003794F560